MAIKNIIAQGIGFSPGTLKWIPTHGFCIGAAAVGNPRVLRTSAVVQRQLLPLGATIVRGTHLNARIVRGTEVEVSRD